jgi:hypothetical protein
MNGKMIAGARKKSGRKKSGTENMTNMAVTKRS